MSLFFTAVIRRLANSSNDFLRPRILPVGTRAPESLTYNRGLMLIRLPIIDADFDMRPPR